MKKIKTQEMTEEFLENASKPLMDIIESTNNDVLSVMAMRIKECGGLSDTDAHRLMIMHRTSDLKAIEHALSDMTDKSVKEIKKMILKVAERNEQMAKEYYKARGIKQVKIAKNEAMQLIINAAQKNMTNEFLNIANSLAFNINGKIQKIRETYIKTIDKAIYQTQQGYIDYYSSMRKTVTQLAESGLQSVKYESGYSRRLDSAVRMNILDGCRLMNVSIREQQGIEFGADGIELSVHGLCAPDHLPYQGLQFSNSDFEKLQATLSRPFFVMNCHHTMFPIIMGISEPVYDKNQLATMNRLSTQKVKFTALNGAEKVLTRYNASQYQRQLETRIRQLKDVRNMLGKSGDEVGEKIYNRKARDYTREYKRISAEMGLIPETRRLVTWQS